jgi:hypothetical protein
MFAPSSPCSGHRAEPLRVGGDMPSTNLAVVEDITRERFDQFVFLIRKM